MPVERFFADQPLDAGTITFSGPELQHLRVIRAQIGSVIEVINGQGALCKAEIEEMDKRSARAKILTCTHETPPAIELEIFQAIPRLNRLDTIVEKGTELGMTKLSLFPGDRSEKKSLSPQQQWRLRHLATSAIKQCGRLHLPEILETSEISKWGQFNGLKLFGDIDPQAPSLSSVIPHAAGQATQIHFVVGPESGLSPKEEEHLRRLGFQGVKLHKNILRTDTAPIVALSVMSHSLM